VVKRSDATVGSLLPAVRRALQRFDIAINLMASRAAGVVLLVDRDLPWAAFAGAVAGWCVRGYGAQTPHPSKHAALSPRANRETQWTHSR